MRFIGSFGASVKYYFCAKNRITQCLQLVIYTVLFYHIFFRCFEPGGVQSDLGFWGVVMMWELGYLPLRRSARHPRLWFAMARRWREFLDQGPSVISRNPVDHLAERFGADV